MRNKLRYSIGERSLFKIDLPSIVIIGSEYCPACEDLKELMEEELESGKAKFFDINSTMGKVFVKWANIQYIPFIIILDFDNEKIYEAEVKDVGEEFELVIKNELG